MCPRVVYFSTIVVGWVWGLLPVCCWNCQDEKVSWRARRGEISFVSQTRTCLLSPQSHPWWCHNSLSTTFSQVLWISTGVPTMHTDQSVLVSYGRGWDQDHGRGKGCDFEGGHGYGRGDQKCNHCGHINHVSKKCWTKFGKPKWTQHTTLPSDSSPSTTDMAYKVTILQAEYDRLV